MPARAALTPARLAYGLYAWLQFLLVGVTGVLLLMCLRPLARRRALVKSLARLALRLAGMPVQVRGLDRLPARCVVVANHQSYLDGVVLAAVLPAHVGFVIKREMSRVPMAGLLLRRIGAEFVERREQAGILRDTRRLLRQASGGQPLVFFPEGTFSTEIGVLRFHIGAFAAAARANLPVAPIAIRGTRNCLAPGSFWPRPGHIQVQVLPVLPALQAPPVRRAEQSARATELRDQARAAVLADTGEPDLTLRAAAVASPHGRRGRAA